MKKDVSTFTRLFIVLLLAFVVWLVLLHNLREQTGFKFIFGNEKASLTILK